MAFLRLIEMLTNNIRRLDQKILEERDNNALLLLSATLENKIKGKSYMVTKEQREVMERATSPCRGVEFLLTTIGATKSEMAPNTLESSKREAIEKIRMQWNTCLEERRKKYEQHKVASNLNYTRQNSERRIIIQYI